MNTGNTLDSLSTFSTKVITTNTIRLDDGFTAVLQRITKIVNFLKSRATDVVLWSIGTLFLI